jgi:hypothetical protein
VNQVKLFAQKNVNTIAFDLIKNDTECKSELPQQEVMAILRSRIRLPTMLKQQNPHIIEELMAPFLNRDTGKIKYRQLLNTF